MERWPEVEALVVEFLGRMKVGDAAVGEMFVVGAATLLVGNAPADWYSGSDTVIRHLSEVLGSDGGLPFVPGKPTVWAEGDAAWFADRVTLVFPHVKIPLRMTGVALRTSEGWRLAQLHLSAAVSDEELLVG